MKTTLRRLPIEGVDFLRTGVAEQKRGIVRSQTEPPAKITGHPEALQVHNLLHFAIADSDSECRWIVRSAQK